MTDEVGHLRQWVGQCNEALDQAVNWKQYTKSKRGARIFVGRIPGQRLVSLATVQTFTDDEEGRTWKLLENILHSTTMFEHISYFDKGYKTGHILKTIPDTMDGALLVHSTFHTRPMVDRDILYLNVRKVIAEGKQIMFCYPSISNEEANRRYDVEVPKLQMFVAAPLYMHFRYVRSENLMPSCDRLTRNGDGRILLERITTRSIRGWVPNVALNTLLKKMIVNAEKLRADGLKSYVENIAFHTGALPQMVFSTEDEIRGPQTMLQ
eukprot:c1695_g1_i1.p1 GENE.c1695_g1_i1~~c1695_g1_i1.p1  ORF type:complete len:266 (-),score=30.94 c1695_g1_i1:114-911(-)